MKDLHDEQAERAVLDACITSPLARKRAREHLDHTDFYSIPHERIWVAMAELDAAERAVDAVSVMAKLPRDEAVARVMPEIISSGGIPDNIDTYADVVRGWAVRRRIISVAEQAKFAALNLDNDPYMLTATAVTKFTELRNTGITEDIQSKLMADLLAEPDDRIEWSVKGFLEKRDRLVLTGSEGGGKSFLARQLGIFAAAGLQPFTLEPAEPVRVQILDYENSWSQVRRGSRRLYDFACEYGSDPRANIHVASLPRIDITRDRDLSRIHRELDVSNPDVVIVGPLYRLTGKAIQSDDEAAPILAALDTMRDRGCALIIEAHAGHTRDSSGERDLRPRGSSALMGWPEFGYGLAPSRRGGGPVRMVSWRGDRSERAWPMYLKRSTSPATHYVPDLDAEIA